MLVYSGLKNLLIKKLNSIDRVLKELAACMDVMLYFK